MESKRKVVNLRRDLWKRIKVMAVINGTSMQDELDRAVDEHCPEYSVLKGDADGEART